jgi:hypothetical protein
MGMVFNILMNKGGIRVSKLKKHGDATELGIQIGDEVTGLNDTPLHSLLANTTDLMAFHQLMNADEMWIQSNSVGLVINFNGSEQNGSDAPVAAYAAAVAAKSSSVSALLWSRWALKAAAAVAIKRERRREILEREEHGWIGDSNQEQRRSSIQWELEEERTTLEEQRAFADASTSGSPNREVSADGATLSQSHGSQVFQKLMEKGFEVARMHDGTQELITGVFYLDQSSEQIVCDCSTVLEDSPSKPKGFGRFFRKSSKKAEQARNVEDVISVGVQDVVEMQYAVDHPLRLVLIHTHGRLVIQLPTQQARDTVVSNFNELLPYLQGNTGSQQQYEYEQHQHDQLRGYQPSHQPPAPAADGNTLNAEQIRALETQLAQAELELEQQKQRQNTHWDSHGKR